MKYLLDTCVISDFVKGEKNTLAKIQKTSPAEIAISSVTLMEIYYGMSLNSKIAKVISPIIKDFLEHITLLDYGQEDAKQTAMVRASLKQRGCPIGSYDVLLAGTALNHQLIFVTSNVNEFVRVEGLVLENWRN